MFYAKYILFFLYITNIFCNATTSVNSADNFLHNKLSYEHVPIRESALLTRNRQWPHYNGIGCIASDKPNNISYLVTTTEHYSWDSRRCSGPPRKVEIIKLDVSKKQHQYVAKLYKNSGECNDNKNTTYLINSNLQLCYLRYPGGDLIQNKINSILLKAGHKLKLITNCEGSQNNIYRTIDNTNSTEDKCFIVNKDNNKYKNPDFEHNDWVDIHTSNNSPIIIENKCNIYNYLWNPTGIAYNGCNYICCMPNYVNIGYLRFVTEPNPMIIDRLLIGNPLEYDSFLEKRYTGSLGSDMVRTCGIDTQKNVLYYIGSNVYNCASSYNTDSSIVRIYLNNFTYRNRIKFEDLNLPEFTTSSYYKKYYNNPTSSVVDPGKYVYITFYNIYTAIFKIDIAKDNISMDSYIRPTFEDTSIITDDWQSETSNNIITMRYYSKSAIDIERRFAYFLNDPVNYGDTSYIIKVNLTDSFVSNSNTTLIKKVQGVTGISKMTIDKYTGILYVFTGDKKPLRFYHFDENLEKIILENSCGQDSLELPIERTMRDFDIDYRTGYIYSLSEFAPFAGVSRISSENLQFLELNDSFPITVPFSVARQHYFNDDHLLVGKDLQNFNHQDLYNPDAYFYTERLNNTAIFEELSKTLIATTVDGPNLPYIFILDNFGCIPGRGLKLKQCSSCLAGYYSNIISYEPCISCNEGTASNKIGSINCNNCDTGKYANSKGHTECKNCDAGYYNNIQGGINCDACEMGKYLPSIGSTLETDCKICLEGEVSGEGESLCSRCAGGEYKSGVNECKKCPNGKYGENIGGNSIEYCQNCPIGKYLDQSGQTSINACKSCIAGKINAITGAMSNTSCKKCEMGKYRSISMLECLECVDGSISSILMDKCKLCDPGKYSTNGIFCTNCDDGYYSKNNGSSFCQECSAGKISSYDNSKCISCTKGFYEDNRKNCIKCSIDKYSSQSDSQSCIYCQTGNIVSENNTNCQPCSPGYYTDDNIICKNCQKGSFAKNSASNECIICPNGYISNIALNDCIPCPAGKYASGDDYLDHITCISCDKGKYSETEAGNSPTVCLNCPEGSWSDKIALNNSTGCNMCEPGYYSDVLGAIDLYTCKMCLSGKYNSYQGAKKETDCIDSRLGTYSGDAYTRSIECPMGKYSNLLGSSSCSYCEQGKYSDITGTIYCKDCPENSEQNRDKTNWICSEGSYESVNGTDRECITCPLNTICPKGTTLETISLNNGYWRENKQSLSILECRKMEYCIGGIYENSTNICRKGHKGPLCDICINGYAKIGGLCEVCPESNKSLNIFLSILFLLIVSSVLVFLIKTANDTDSSRDEFSGVLKVLTNYLQVFSLAKNFDIKWPPIIVTMFDAAETASGPSIQFYSTQCAIGWNYYQRFIVYLSMPIGYLILTILALTIANCVNKCIISKKRKSIRPANLLNFDKNHPTDMKFISKWLKTSAVVGLFLMYPTVIKNLLQIINCTQVNNRYYLNKDFNIVCYEGIHQVYAYVAYIFIFIYGFGIPYGAFHFLYNYRNRLYSSNVVSSLKFIYIEYKPNRYYWEMVIMFRKIAIIFMSVFLFSRDTSRYQMIIASWLVQFCLFLHIAYQPYDTITEFGQLCNRLEIMSLSSLVVTLNSGIVFGTNKDNYKLGFFESILSVAVLFINVVICIKFAYHIFITGSTKTKTKIKKLCNKVLNKSDGSRRCSARSIRKCFCGNYIEKMRRWSVTKINIPHTLSIYEVPKAIKYNEMLNTRSKGTLLLDRYLEELRNVDKKCYNNISEKLLQFHSKIELHQRNHLDNVIKYNNIIYELQETVYKNLDKDKDNLSIALDLFIADAIEHRNTILDLYNDGVSYKSSRFKSKITSNIVEKCLDDIITKIENSTEQHFIELEHIDNGQLSFEIEKEVIIKDGEKVVNSTNIII